MCNRKGTVKRRMSRIDHWIVTNTATSNTNKAEILSVGVVYETGKHMNDR